MKAQLGVLLILASLLMAPAAARGDDPSATGRAHGLRPVPGSYLVTLRDDLVRGSFAGALQRMGARIRHEYHLTPGRLNVRGVPPGLEEELRRLPEVLAVTSDYEVRAHLAESVPLIGGEPVPAPGDGGAGIDVCVLDTGIHPDHLMFDPTRLIAWNDFVDGASAPYDDQGHGSNVAGIIVGRQGLTLGGRPFHGVAPRANLLVGKVLDSSGSGLFSDVIAGIEWCVTQGAEVINLSLGAGAFSEACDASDPTGTAQAVNAAAAAGVLVVSSAGNERNSDAVPTPACASGSMAIGATYDADLGRLRFSGCTDRDTAADQLACFSNRWHQLDVVAPGCLVYSADPTSNSGVVGMCGTSQAAPHVAGLSALVLAAQPGRSAAQARDCIRSTARDLGDPGFDPAFGHGRIDVAAALACDSSPPSCTPQESPEQSCQDATDNDCDGLIDGADPDCSATPMCRPAKASCSTGADCCSGTCRRGVCRGG